MGSQERENLLRDAARCIDDSMEDAANDDNCDTNVVVARVRVEVRVGADLADLSPMPSREACRGEATWALSTKTKRPSGVGKRELRRR